MNPFIEIKDVSKEYIDGESTVSVLKNANMEINKGEKIAVIGSSGCGKTTLINLIGLLIKPTAGEILVNGKKISSLSIKERANVRNSLFGYIFQEFVLIEENTVYENIEVPLLYTKEKTIRIKRKEIIRKVLDKVDLQAKTNTKVKKLSGGQRQRVAIARAIINNPKLILADEPTGSLDLKNGETILNILDELVNDGKTLIIVTHNKEIAERCDKKYLIHNGSIYLD